MIKKPIKIKRIAQLLSLFLVLLITNCQVDENAANTELSTNREQLFFKDVTSNKQSRNEANSTMVFLENENKKTQFLQKISDQKGIPIWKNSRTFKSKSLTNKNSESSQTIIPLSDNDKNLSSLLFVDRNTNGKSTIYTITNEELFKIVNNTEISKETREAILMEFLYFDYLSFGRRLYTNIPIDLFPNVKVKKNKDYKEFKISISNTEKPISLTSRQVSDVCVSFNVCDGRCYGACDECSSCTSSRCYGFGGSTAPGNFGSSEGGDGGSTGGGGSSGGGGTSGTPWYLMNPDVDIYKYPTKVRNVFKNLTDYDVILQREQLDYLKNNPTILNDITLLLVNNSQDKADFTNNVISALNDGAITTYKQFTITVENFKYSLKSPCNVDLSSILENPTLPENEKFKTLYDALTASPTFQKFFIAIFKNSTRFNVKFEIDEHVYEDNDPAKKEVNATTSQDPITKNIIIKVSRQILIAGTTKSQTKIENTKTILHECIHAYLLTITSYPLVGMDIAEVMNKVLPASKEQHDFMYNNMLPVMTKVLTDIRDLVTSEPRRVDVSDLKIYTKVDKSAFEIWNWTNYYECISINGLEEANFYKVDYPNPSDALFLWNQYINYGHARLDKN
nr:hypothetical protein [uncultured Flavobacterium sp.]